MRVSSEENVVVYRPARSDAIEELLKTKNAGNKTKSVGKWTKNAACLSGSWI